MNLKWSLCILLAALAATTASATELSQAFHECVTTGKVERVQIEGTDRSFVGFVCRESGARKVFDAVYAYDNHCDETDWADDDGNQWKARYLSEKGDDGASSWCNARTTNSDGELVSDRFTCYINLKIRPALNADIIE